MCTHHLAGWARITRANFTAWLEACLFVKLHIMFLIQWKWLSPEEHVEIKANKPQEGVRYSDFSHKQVFS